MCFLENQCQNLNLFKSFFFSLFYHHFYSSSKIEFFTSESAEKKVVGYILSLPYDKENKHVKLDIKMSKLAQNLDIGRASLYRAFDSLEEKGFIKKENAQLVTGTFEKGKIPELLSEYGVKIACENMWCGDGKRKIKRGSIFSNPHEHARFVDEMNSEFFVACLDLGHTSLDGREPQDSIRVLGNRLGALHVHDNDYLDDMHTLPGLSEMNWEEITKALAEVNYQGDFTLETNHFFDSFETEEEINLGLKLSEVIGRKMIAKIEKHRIKISE